MTIIRVRTQADAIGVLDTLAMTGRVTGVPDGAAT
jgi:hypothetical protein